MLTPSMANSSNKTSSLFVFSLLVFVAMKMNNEITAPSSGNIEGLNLEIGAQVQEGDLLLRILSA